MPPPNQLSKINFPSLQPDEQKQMDQLVDTINFHSGYNGPISLANHIDMGGRRITNVGAPQSPTDALPSVTAEARYSALALRPHISPGGKASMSGYRQIGSQSQREPTSSHLNDLMSSVPSANAIFPFLTNVMGGVQVAIAPSLFTFADGSTVLLQGRTDILSLPTTFVIATIGSVGDLVTVTTTAPNGLSSGEVVGISGVTPSGFNGTQQLTSATPPVTFTYQDSLGTVSGSGGVVSLNGVYYYAVAKRSRKITILGPFFADTAQNRLDANFDGFQIVAVVVITGSGGSVSQTGGGGSPVIGSPAAGAFF